MPQSGHPEQKSLHDSESNPRLDRNSNAADFHCKRYRPEGDQESSKHSDTNSKDSGPKSKNLEYNMIRICRQNTNTDMSPHNTTIVKLNRINGNALYHGNKVQLNTKSHEEDNIYPDTPDRTYSNSSNSMVEEQLSPKNDEEESHRVDIPNAVRSLPIELTDEERGKIVRGVLEGMDERANQGRTRSSRFREWNNTTGNTIVTYVGTFASLAMGAAGLYYVFHSPTQG